MYKHSKTEPCAHRRTRRHICFGLCPGKPVAIFSRIIHANTRQSTHSPRHVQGWVLARHCPASSPSLPPRTDRALATGSARHAASPTSSTSPPTPKTVFFELDLATSIPRYTAPLADNIKRPDSARPSPSLRTRPTSTNSLTSMGCALGWRRDIGWTRRLQKYNHSGHGILPHGRILGRTSYDIMAPMMA